MEDNFRVRVEKAFGSLAASSSSDTSLNSLWRLTDEEVERREWNRDKDDSPDDLEPEPFPSNLDGFFANRQLVSPENKPPSDSDFRKLLESDLEDLKDDDDDDDDGDDEKQRCGSTARLSSVKPDDQDQEEWDIRSSIGLDCTLDYEEEEDAHDKVAVGREQAGDRLYMRDTADYIADINSYKELPNTFRDVARDPRADHVAAKIRLKEDAEAAGNFDSLQESYNSAAVDPSVGSPNNTLEGLNLKPILKKRENQMDSKSEKRVRFDPACKDDCEEEPEGTKGLAMETSSMGQAPASVAASFMPHDSSGVPEYIWNPSKFTHYSFDSLTEMDEESNRKAYMDFLNLLKGPNNTESHDDVSIDLPKSVIFTPMKKPGDDSMKNGNAFMQNQEDACKEYMHKKGFPIGIAARGAQESEVCAMEEDEPEIAADKSSSLQRPGRQYRTKSCVDLDEMVT